MTSWFRRPSSGDSSARRRARPYVPPTQESTRSIPQTTVTAGKPTVPYLPVRCPYCNSSEHVRTTGRYSGTTIRYHTCTECDRKFRSKEI